MPLSRFRSKLTSSTDSFSLRESYQPPQSYNLKASSTSASQKRMKRILIINSKGGCGKSTISTNLAAQLNANKSNNVALIDYDPQGSSKKWLATRSKRLRKLHGLFPARDNVVKFKRTWYLLLDPTVSHVVIDTPAGTTGIDLSEKIGQSDMMIVPVMPSAIDMRVTADFIGQTITSPIFRHSQKRIAVVANRVRKGSESFAKLEKFLLSLKIPFVSIFNEHPNYLLAAEYGCGVNELPPSRTFSDGDEWQKLVHWVETA